jgi:uncharacterized membrane protein YphA (DoxX/SURF4 family)
MAAIALFLALVLLVAAAHKAIAHDRMAAAAARLTGSPSSMGSPAAWAAAALELLAGMAMLMPATRTVGGLLAAILWLGYAVLLARHWGQSLDCGCSFGSREKPVGAFETGRALLLALLGIVVALLPAGAITPEAPFAALGLFALLTASATLADNIPGLRRLRA